jgi:hypothetical protein
MWMRNKWMRNKFVQAPISGVVAVAYLLAIGCNGPASGGDEAVVARSEQALSTSAASVLGFESAGDWSIAYAGTESTSSTHTQGSSSLAVKAHGYTVVTSKKLKSLGASVSQTLSLDFLLPTQQLNPWWYGSLQLFVTMPSKGIYNAYVGQEQLTGLPLNTFNRAEFTVPADVLTALRGTYDDLQFSVALNVPSGSVGSYLLDNLNVGTVPHALSGETLFSGLFFGNGPVASLLPDLIDSGPVGPTLLQGDRERLAERLEQFATTLRTSVTPSSAPQATRRIDASTFRPGDTFGNRNDGRGVCGSFGVCNAGEAITFVENGD